VVAPLDDDNVKAAAAAMRCVEAVDRAEPTEAEQPPNGSLPSAAATEPDRPPDDRNEPAPRPLPPTLVIDEVEP
jgi:hypothetical protein